MFHWRNRMVMFRSLSTAVQCLSRSKAQANFISPLDLTEAHVSQVYCLSREEARAMFPQCLPRRFAVEMDTLGHACWVLRQQSYDIMKAVGSFEREKAEESRFLLYGKAGSGKTLCLHQVVQYCVKAGWIVVHIPSVFAWTHSRSELRPSSREEGRFDQPEEAVSWLKHFKTVNSGFIGQLRLGEDYSWTKREKSERGEELGKVIDQGLLKPILATDVVGAVIKEVAKAADRFNLLLVVDEFNGCFNPTTHQLSKGLWVHPSQLNLVRSVTEYTAPGKFPGPVVLALSKTGMKRHFVNGYEPGDLLGKEGMEVVGSCRFIEVPVYVREEMDHCLQYYTQQHWFNRELTGDVADELWHLTAGSPRELARLCSSL